MKTKSITAWAIAGTHGLYEGQWRTRRDAIKDHCHEKGFSWQRCKRNGDYATRVKITWTPK